MGHSLFGQPFHGYVEYEKIAVALPEYTIGQKTLESRKKQLSDSIETIFYEFKRTLDESPHNVKLDSVRKKSLEDMLIKLQKSIQDAQNHSQKELMKTQEIIDINLKDAVKKELKVYCTEKNIFCITEHKSILYCIDCIDFTEDFVNYLKAKVE